MQAPISSLDTKVRINALASYLFLGWMFLLARKNPNFSHPYVRRHAWRATGVHVAFFALIILYHGVFASYLGFFIPFVGISVRELGTVLVYGAGLFAILVLARDAYRGTDAREIAETGHALSRTCTHRFSSDRGALIAVASFVPIFGFFIHARHENDATADGIRIGGSFALLFALSGFAFGAHASAMVVTLLYSIVFAWAAISAFTVDRLEIPALIRRIPLPLSWYVNIEAALLFIRHIFEALFFGRERVSFSAALENIRDIAAYEEQAYESAHPDTRFPLPIELLCIPMLGLLFLPLILSRPESRYRRLAFQMLLLSVAFGSAVALGWSVVAGLLLVLFALAMSVARSRPGVLLPLVGSVYTRLCVLARLVSGKSRDVRRKIPARQQTVSYRVGEHDADSGDPSGEG